MAEGDTSVTICSQALIKLGQGAINTLMGEAGSVEDTCGRLYPTLRRECLGKYPWSWTQKRAALSRITAADDQPVAEYEYVFQMPPDRLLDGLVGLYTSSEPNSRALTQDWEVHGDKLYANETELWAEYQSEPDEGLWPSVFVSFVVSALASRLAIPITDQKVLRDDYELEAYGHPVYGRGKLQAALSQDSGTQPYTSLSEDTLNDARRGFRRLY